jgi:hypothetical protein
MFKTRPCIRRTALLSDPEFNLPGRTSGLAIMAITYSQDVRKSMVLIPEWGKDESGTVLLWDCIKGMSYVGHCQVKSTLKFHDQRALYHSMMALRSAFTQFTHTVCVLLGATVHFVFRRQHDAHVMVVEDDPQGDMCGEACIDIEIPPVEFAICGWNVCRMFSSECWQNRLADAGP